MTAKEFVDRYLGVEIDTDGAYGVQCVDLFKLFTKVNYGVWEYTCGNGYASGLWLNRKSRSYYQYFEEVDINKLQDGDWCFWNNGAEECPDSHVAMYYQGQFFGQNQGVKRATLKSISKSGMLGALRPKMYIVKHNIGYTAHIQNIGWQEEKYDGETAGSTNKALRLEAIKINYDKPIYAKAHVEKKGWVDYGLINKDTVIGTTGEGLRLEALCLKGNFKYRVHIQGTGWTQWTNADGIITLGTVGQKLRIEAIEIEEL